MATDGRTKAIIDTSVLINFLKIDRCDLLARHPNYRFVVIDLVRDEVGTRPCYAQHRSTLESAIAEGLLLPDDPPETISLSELEAFAKMQTLKIGNGERAAIAAAFARNMPLAMDDRRAWSQSAKYSAAVERTNTVSIMLQLIKAGAITVAEADTIKMDWQNQYRFTISDFRSFAERL